MKPNQSRSLWQRIMAFLGENEKVLLALLSVVIVISGSFWFRQFAATQENQPTPGGTFVDGVVGARLEIEEEVARLTKAGLFSFDKNGNLANQLVSDWSVSSDHTTYRFDLLPGVPVGEIKNSLTLEGNILGTAVVTTEKSQLIITLQKPDPSLPLLLAQPLFDFGPYKVNKISDQTAVLVRNTRDKAVSGYINRIVIDAFATEERLLTALKKHKVDGALVSRPDTRLRGYQTKSFNLPRYYTALFNLNRVPFRDQNFGKAVVSGQTIPQPAFTLTAPDSEPYATLAKNLVSQWQAVSAVVNLESKSEAEIKDQIGPTRNFQALLGGIDYGYELDPYYLWHSSQIRPPDNNLTGIKNTEVDAQIDQIRLTTNIVERQSRIATLHQLLQSQGVAQIIEQEKATYLISNDIRSINPWTPDVAADWLQAIALWSVK